MNNSKSPLYFHICIGILSKTKATLNSFS